MGRGLAIAVELSLRTFAAAVAGLVPALGERPALAGGTLSRAAPAACGPLVFIINHVAFAFQRG
jgi:hypothetical protein